MGAIQRDLPARKRNPSKREQIEEKFCYPEEGFGLEELLTKMYWGEMMSTTEIAKEFAKELDVSSAVVIKWLKRYKIPLRNYQAAGAVHYSNHPLRFPEQERIEKKWGVPLEDLLMALYWDEGKGSTTIAEELGVSSGTVILDWFKKHSIPIRTIQETRKIYNTKHPPKSPIQERIEEKWGLPIEDLLMALYWGDEKNTIEIIGELGVSSPWISRMFGKLCIPTRGRGESTKLYHDKYPLTAEQERIEKAWGVPIVDLLTAMYWGLEMSTQEMAKELDVSNGMSIVKWFRKYHISTRERDKANNIRYAKYPPKHPTQERIERKEGMPLKNLLRDLHFGEELGVTKIAQQLDVSTGFIYKSLIRFNIPFVSPKQLNRLVDLVRSYYSREGCEVNKQLCLDGVLKDTPYHKIRGGRKKQLTDILEHENVLKLAKSRNGHLFSEEDYNNLIKTIFNDQEFLQHLIIEKQTRQELSKFLNQQDYSNLFLTEEYVNNHSKNPNFKITANFVYAAYTRQIQFDGELTAFLKVFEHEAERDKEYAMLQYVKDLNLRSVTHARKHNLRKSICLQEDSVTETVWLSTMQTVITNLRDKPCSYCLVTEFLNAKTLEERVKSEQESLESVLREEKLSKEEREEARAERKELNFNYLSALNSALAELHYQGYAHRDQLPQQLDPPLEKKLQKKDYQAHFSQEISGEEEFVRFYQQLGIGRTLDDYLAREENIAFVHGDSHLQNILMDKEDNCYLIDFEFSHFNAPQWDLSRALTAAALKLELTAAEEERLIEDYNRKREEYTSQPIDQQEFRQAYDYVTIYRCLQSLRHAQARHEVISPAFRERQASKQWEFYKKRAGEATRRQFDEEKAIKLVILIDRYLALPATSPASSAPHRQEAA